MTLDKYHFSKDRDQRKLKKEWAERATKVYDETKKDSLPDAIKYMKEHGWSLRIHKEDWRIQEERTYPKKDDPTQSPG